MVPGSWYQDLGSWILVLGSWYQDLGITVLVPESYQDLSTRILVSKCRTENLRGGASPKLKSVVCKPCQLGALEEQQGSGRRQPPSKINFMNPEPPSDHLQPPSITFRPPSNYLLTTFNHPPTTFNHLQPPSTDHLPITIFREKGRIHNHPSGQNFRTAWLITGQKFP